MSIFVHVGLIVTSVLIRSSLSMTVINTSMRLNFGQIGIFSLKLCALGY